VTVRSGGPRPPTQAGASLVYQLRNAVLVKLAELLPDRPPVALLDVPSKANWGDNAIWMGERRAFQHLGLHLRYETDDRLFSPFVASEQLGDDGVAILHGGGSVGDLYPPRQAFREHVLSSLRHRRVIQLPQSIHFADKRNLDRCKRAFGSHPSFVLLVRDEASLEFADREFDCDVRICPDMAFALGPLRAPNEARVDILWIDRRDLEAVRRDDIEDSARVLRSDWAPPAQGTLLNMAQLALPAVQTKLRRFADAHGRYRSPTERLRKHVLRFVPRARFALAVRFICQGRVIVTDRLHAHILSLLVGRASVLLENRIGKLKAFYETWTREAASVSFATDAREALRVAGDLATSSLERAP
jgi:exopolysaccharide biosynthesis predicted pyruvyltransferase EpsI